MKYYSLYYQNVWANALPMGSPLCIKYGKSTQEEIPILGQSIGASFASRQLIVSYREGAVRHAVLSAYRRGGDRVLFSNRKLKYDLIRVKEPVRKAQKRYSKMPFVKYAEPNFRRYASAVPNDPLFNLQYGLPQIDAPDAWNLTVGQPGSIVAVVDTGVMSNHPDLAGKLLNGYNFVDNNSNWNDDNGHGTHVAGIAAAITNNGIGVAGTAPLNRILPVKSLNADGYGTIETLARGIVYAADQGASVINMSFGSAAYSSLEEEACNYALSKGSVLVAAAGNAGTTAPQYPAYLNSVLSVAATDENDQKADFSTYGQWVEVAAPGVDILSTYNNGGYEYESGTSMSAPFVSGLAGLLAAQGRTNSQIREIVAQTADPIEGTGTYWAYGRINAAAAVEASFVPGMLPVGFRAPFRPENSLLPRVTARSRTGQWVRYESLYKQKKHRA